MQKRGDISIEALVKFIPHFVLVCVLIAALVVVYKIALPKEQESFAVDDLDRLVMNVNQLSPEEVAPVFTTTHGHTFVLYQEGLADLPQQCGKSACLCVQAADQPLTCRQLQKIGKECSSSQCEFKPMCITKASQDVTIKNPGDSVYACRSCTEVIISAEKTACLRHVQQTGT